MSDPADKSDDLIAELAKLMATAPQGADAAVKPMARPVPINPQAGAPAATNAAPAVRVPGMQAPAPRTATINPLPEQRAPATGSIRIPGMDQPAPVSTSAPVSKFDFGKPVAAAPIKQESLSSLADRIAARNAETDARAVPQRVEPTLTLTPNPQPVRVPSELKPVSENRSFGEAPALSVTRPPQAPVRVPEPAPAADEHAGGNDFHFDFGFGQNPPASASPPRPQQPDPIADLIAADMAEDHPPVEPAPRSAPVAPVQRTTVSPQAVPARPVMTPVASANVPRPASSTPIPLKPASAPPRPPETDRFAISPGVGLNMRPQPSQPLSPPAAPRAPQPSYHTDASDPMSEIESLIGEAVRVELAAPGPVRVQQVAPTVELEAEDELEAEIAHHEPPPAPVVPPLTTQFAPRRSGLKNDPGASSAEDAILAAAAVTGAEVGRIEMPAGDDSPYRRLKVKPQRAGFFSGGMRQYVGMAVAGTLLLAAGLGLYWVLNMGRTANTTGASAPQLTADATPIKVKPAATPKADNDTARSPVLQQMSGDTSAVPAEQLVSTDETNGGNVSRDVTPAAATDESGLANRKVRTVTVRPDGTIVSGDDAVAGAEEMPIERPNVPSVPSSEATSLLGDDGELASTDALTTGAGGNPATTAEDATTAVADIQPVMDPSIVAPTPLPRPVRTTALAFSPPAAAKPSNPVNAVVSGAQTPNGQIDLLGGNTQQVAAADPAPVSASGAAAYVQLASSPSQSDAQSQARSASNKYGSLFGGTKLVVQSADLGAKGTWYRVRLPAASLTDATRICAAIKANGGDCIVSNG